MALGLATASWAEQGADPILGDEPQFGSQENIANPKLTVEPAKPAQEDDVAIGKRTLKKKKSKLWLMASGGVQFATYSLSGVGFTASVPANTGSVFGGGLRAFLSDSNNTSLFGRGKFASTSYSNIVGVFPSNISVQKNYYALGFSLFPFAFSNSFGLNLGYAYRTRNSTSTAPQQVVSVYNSHGPLFGLAYVDSSDDKFKLEGSLDLMAPIGYSEGSSNTGFFRSALSTEATITLRYAFSPQFWVGFAPYVRYDGARFNGTGQRGVTGAGEDDWTFGFPIELGVNVF